MWQAAGEFVMIVGIVNLVGMQEEETLAFVIAFKPLHHHLGSAEPVRHLIVIDNGEPGRGVDIFELTTEPGDNYSSNIVNNNVITKGNIQAHYEDPD